MTDYMDPDPVPPTDHAAEAQKMLEGMGPGWEAGVTVGRQATITRPGWQITRQWSNFFQAIVISSKYRFSGQGDTPMKALEDVKDQMHKFKQELEEHLKNV